MSHKLFMTMLKENQRSISGFAFGTVLYMWMVIWIYPSLAKSSGMNEMLQSMPKNFLSAFGLENGIQKLSDYLAAEFYGLLFLIILSIYSVMAATQLVARLVDRGSMAYLLSTPTSRVKIAVTQMSVLLFGLLVIVLFATAGGLLGTLWISGSAELDTVLFLKMNLVGFLLFFVISAYSFFFSCLFNDEKKATSVSAVVTIIFFAVHLIGRLSPDVDWLLNLTIFSAFDPQEISNGTDDILISSLGLLGAGILLYILSIIIFRKKDLPL